MHQPRICALVITIIALLQAAVYARQQGQARPAPTGPTGLALEIVFLKGQPASLFPVAAPQSKQSGGWSGRFGKVAGWKVTEGTLPVMAVQVQTRLEEGKVKVWVSVLHGQQAIEQEEAVTALELAEGDKVEVKDLTRFGVEPIEIKVVKAPRRAAVLPQVVNKTQTMMMTDMAPNDTTLPSYHIELQNYSNKDVAALRVEIQVGGKQEIIMAPQGTENRPLVPVGMRLNLPVNASYQVRPSYGDHPPDFTQNHDCVIRTVIFSDGSFEGDPEPAADFRAAVVGRKIQLRRVVAQLQEALDFAGGADVALRRLRSGFSDLNVNVEESEAQALLAEFPDLPDKSKAGLISRAKSSLGFIKKTVIEELITFEKEQPAPDRATFQSWLQARKEKYAGWLSRL
jgi:hypothetical protein